MKFNQYYSSVRLKTGDYCGLLIKKIISIPSYTILSDESDQKNLIEEIKDGFADLLYEVYRISESKVSFEILWTTSPALNQTYSANVNIFMIVRAISDSDEKAYQLLSNFEKNFTTTLDILKFEHSFVNYNQLKTILDNIKKECNTSLVKQEKIENLQNQLLPYCYVYDKFPDNSFDLGRILNTLINYPNSMLSFQLIPTTLQVEETNALESTTQSLGMLAKGIMDQNIGQTSFALAENYVENYKYYTQNKNNPLFLYNILILGSSNAVSTISSRIRSQLSSGEQTKVGMKAINLTNQEVRLDSNFYPMPWALNEIIINKNREESIWKDGRDYSKYRLPYIITSYEASEFFRLPFGSEKVTAGIKINESVKKSKNYYSNVINSADLPLGKLKSSPENILGFNLKDLTKHMLVTGMPGSGKTTYCIGVLNELWKTHKTPFLVIEPAKNEYRALIESIPDLQVFTMGKNDLSPFIINPFVPPKNVKLSNYKSSLKTAFEAGVIMSSPLDKIFETSIYNCYSDYGWFDFYTSKKGKMFNIEDFIKCFERTFAEIGYVGEAKNIGKAGTVRLEGLINLFDNYFSVPIEDILTKPTVIELSAIENSDDKSLIIALILISVLSYVNNNFHSLGELKTVLLLEEAHVLLAHESNSSEGEANPNAVAKRLLMRMLAEIRAYGVGIIVADQSPKKVSSDVVALTDIKVTFRLVERHDKEMIANSTSLTEGQISRLGKFRPGEAFAFYNKLQETEEVITENYRATHHIGTYISDKDLKSKLTYWKQNSENLRPYKSCSINPYCQKDCIYKTRQLGKEISNRIFRRYIGNSTDDFERVKKVFGSISTLVERELNDEKFTKRLLSCVKTHLFRMIKYKTKIKLSDEIVRQSLQKK